MRITTGDRSPVLVRSNRACSPYTGNSRSYSSYRNGKRTCSPYAESLRSFSPCIEGKRSCSPNGEIKRSYSPYTEIKRSYSPYADIGKSYSPYSESRKNCSLYMNGRTGAAGFAIKRSSSPSVENRKSPTFQKESSHHLFPSLDNVHSANTTNSAVNGNSNGCNSNRVTRDNDSFVKEGADFLKIAQRYELNKYEESIKDTASENDVKCEEPEDYIYGDASVNGRHCLNAETAPVNGTYGAVSVNGRNCIKAANAHVNGLYRAMSVTDVNNQESANGVNGTVPVNNARYIDVVNKIYGEVSVKGGSYIKTETDVKNSLPPNGIYGTVSVNGGSYIKSEISTNGAVPENGENCIVKSENGVNGGTVHVNGAKCVDVGNCNYGSVPVNGENCIVKSETGVNGGTVPVNGAKCVDAANCNYGSVPVNGAKYVDDAVNGVNYSSERGGPASRGGGVKRALSPCSPTSSSKHPPKKKWIHCYLTDGEASDDGSLCPSIKSSPPSHHSSPHTPTHHHTTPPLTQKSNNGACNASPNQYASPASHLHVSPARHTSSSVLGLSSLQFATVGGDAATATTTHPVSTTGVRPHLVSRTSYSPSSGQQPRRTSPLLQQQQQRQNSNALQVLSHAGVRPNLYIDDLQRGGTPSSKLDVRARIPYNGVTTLGSRAILGMNSLNQRPATAPSLVPLSSVNAANNGNGLVSVQQQQIGSNCLIGPGSSRVAGTTLLSVPEVSGSPTSAGSRSGSFVSSSGSSNSSPNLNNSSRTVLIDSRLRSPSTSSATSATDGGEGKFPECTNGVTRLNGSVYRGLTEQEFLQQQGQQQFGGSPTQQQESNAAKEDINKRRPGPLATPSREVHNKLEKNRRAHLKECFDHLRRQIPNMDDKKVSNQNILKAAYKCINNLKRKERDLEHEMERLARDKISHQQQLASLKKDLAARWDHIDFTSMMPDMSTLDQHRDKDTKSTTTASEQPDMMDDDMVLQDLPITSDALHRIGGGGKAISNGGLASLSGTTATVLQYHRSPLETSNNNNNNTLQGRRTILFGSGVERSTIPMMVSTSPVTLIRASSATMTGNFQRKSLPNRQSPVVTYAPHDPNSVTSVVTYTPQPSPQPGLVGTCTHHISPQTAPIVTYTPQPSPQSPNSLSFATHVSPHTFSVATAVDISHATQLSNNILAAEDINNCTSKVQQRDLSFQDPNQPLNLSTNTAIIAAPLRGAPNVSLSSVQFSQLSQSDVLTNCKISSPNNIQQATIQTQTSSPSWFVQHQEKILNEQLQKVELKIVDGSNTTQILRPINAIPKLTTMSVVGSISESSARLRQPTAQVITTLSPSSIAINSSSHISQGTTNITFCPVSSSVNMQAAGSIVQSSSAWSTVITSKSPTVSQSVNSVAATMVAMQGTTTMLPDSNHCKAGNNESYTVRLATSSVVAPTMISVSHSNNISNTTINSINASHAPNNIINVNNSCSNSIISTNICTNNNTINCTALMPIVHQSNTTGVQHIPLRIAGAGNMVNIIAPELGYKLISTAEHSLPIAAGVKPLIVALPSQDLPQNSSSSCGNERVATQEPSGGGVGGGVVPVAGFTRNGVATAVHVTVPSPAKCLRIGVGGSGAPLNLSTSPSGTSIVPSPSAAALRIAPNTVMPSYLPYQTSNGVSQLMPGMMVTPVVVPAVLNAGTADAVNTSSTVTVCAPNSNQQITAVATESNTRRHLQQMDSQTPANNSSGAGSIKISNGGGGQNDSTILLNSSAGLTHLCRSKNSLQQQQQLCHSNNSNNSTNNLNNINLQQQQLCHSNSISNNNSIQQQQLILPSQFSSHYPGTLVVVSSAPTEARTFVGPAAALITPPATVAAVVTAKAASIYATGPE